MARKQSRSGQIKGAATRRPLYLPTPEEMRRWYTYLPTAEDIRRWCLYFQSTWTAEEEAKRRPATRAWLPQGIDRAERLAARDDE
ncbi:MAG TPA: hypothetical protein VFG04_08955 [Planctomycetaceae bacterium]|nr:hypothetical protein [Planctomycetaceae bacterium]